MRVSMIFLGKAPAPPNKVVNPSTPSYPNPPSPLFTTSPPPLQAPSFIYSPTHPTHKEIQPYCTLCTLSNPPSPLIRKSY